MVSKQQALDLIFQQLHKGELIFPTNMAAALKLQRTLDDPDCHLDAASDLVLAEPLVAARIVSIANSVAYSRYGRNVSNVRSAVSVLGLNRLRGVVAAIVIRQLSDDISDASIRNKAEQLWHHCAQVAAIAKVIARAFTSVDPEMALFSGVVHELDGFYLLSRAQEFPTILAPATLTTVDTELRTKLAQQVMQALKIPRAVATAVQGLHIGIGQWPPVSAADVLWLANGLASVQSPQIPTFMATSERGIAEGNSALNEEALQTMLAASADEVTAITNALLI